MSNKTYKCVNCIVGVSGACNLHLFYTPEEVEKLCDKNPNDIKPIATINLKNDKNENRTHN